jgi:transmembrane sensor
MGKPVDLKLVARYMSGECTQEERDVIEARMPYDSQLQHLVDLMREVWNVPEADSDEVDLKVLWQEVALRAGILRAVEKRQLHKKTWRLSQWTFRQHPVQALRYVAIIILAVFIPYLIFRTFGFPWASWNREVNVITVDTGKRFTVTLEDGSRVTLDAGSRLAYPKEFETEVREVILEGEGFFEIAPDTERPFTVHAYNARVRVLGTKFNIRAWESSQGIVVSVTEGKVFLESSVDVSNAGVVLTQGQMSILKDNGIPSEPVDVDAEEYLGWMHNEIVFHDAPLGEVLRQLERWYGLHFLLSDPSLADERVSVHIRQTSVDDILELVSALSGCPFIRQGQTVRF